jgi:hypothetical protein
MNVAPRRTSLSSVPTQPMRDSPADREADAGPFLCLWLERGVFLKIASRLSGRGRPGDGGRKASNRRD